MLDREARPDIVRPDPPGTSQNRLLTNYHRDSSF
jgi:hypothetical protein